MSDWLNTPVIVVALLAVLTVFWTMARWTGMVDSGIRELKDGQKELRDDVKTILGRLPSKVIESGSPIRLTDLGVEVATALKAETWASDAATRLEEEVAGKRDFEIEQFASNTRGPASATSGATESRLAPTALGLTHQKSRACWV